MRTDAEDRGTAELVALVVMFVVVLALALGGCSLRGHNLSTRTAASIAPDPALEARCAKFDNAQIGITVGIAIDGVLGGSSGLAALFSSPSRYVTAGIALGTAVVAAGLGAGENAVSARYTRQCTASATGAP